MAIYISYIIVVSFEKFMIKPDISTTRKKIFVFLSFFQLLILVGLRGYNVGADTSKYLEYYDYYKNASFRQVIDFSDNYANLELGYNLLMKLCGWLRLNKTAFLFVVAFLIYAPLFLFIKDIPYCELAILCFFAIDGFRYSLGIFRQMIAVSLCLLSIKFIIKQRLWLFVLCSLAAFLFHKTAILWLAVYPLYKVVHKQKAFLIISLVISYAMIIFGRSIVYAIMLILPKYEHYIGTQYDIQGGTYLKLIMFYAILFGMALFRYFDEHMIWGLGDNEQKISIENRWRKTELENIAVIMFGMCLMVQATAYSFALMGRTVIYYSTSLLVLLPSFIQGCFKKKDRPFIQALVFVFLMVLSIYSLNDSTICPYSFFWGN